MLRVIKKLSIIFFSLFFFYMGCNHFIHDSEFAKITPLPYAFEIVWVTGVMELVFSVFLLTPGYRRKTGILLSVYLLAVLPANINMAVNNIPMFGPNADPWILWLRVVLQFPLIAWVLWATGVLGGKKVINA